MTEEPKRKRVGGRPKGVPNKATADLQGIARQYTPEAIEKLVYIMRNREDYPAAQISAIKELLDRGYGRSTQKVIGDSNEPPVKMVIEWATPKQGS
jgi:hypothetical protein